MRVYDSQPTSTLRCANCALSSTTCPSACSMRPVTRDISRCITACSSWALRRLSCMCTEPSFRFSDSDLAILYSSTCCYFRIVDNICWASCILCSMIIYICSLIIHRIFLYFSFVASCFCWSSCSCSCARLDSSFAAATSDLSPSTSVRLCHSCHLKNSFSMRLHQLRQVPFTCVNLDDANSSSCAARLACDSACACMRACMRACMHACVRACLRLVRACVPVCVCLGLVCVSVCACLRLGGTALFVQRAVLS